MSTIQEHRTHFRKNDNAYTLEVIEQDDYGGVGHRVAVRLDVADPDGRAVATGQFDVDAAELTAVAEVLSDQLMSAAGRPRRARRGPREQPANTGRPWTAELDADLEKRWIAGDDLRAIAADFGRTQSAIMRRLPLIGCDPYTPGAYLPPPPSQRDGETS